MYVLERHITRYQGLQPGARRLGLHRGESYYDRASVSDLHSAERWRREGRQVGWPHCRYLVASVHPNIFCNVRHHHGGEAVCSPHSVVLAIYRLARSVCRLKPRPYMCAC